MLQRAILLVTLAALLAGCAQTGTTTVSEAQMCVQGGGTWRPALGVCDRSAGGGGY